MPSAVRPYEMAGRAAIVEPAGRERAVVVADLVEHLRGLAQQPLVLVLIEARLREDLGGEVDERVEVAGQREPRQHDRVAADRDLERRAEAVEGVVEGGAVAGAGAAPREQRRVAVQALGPDRITRGAAVDRDVDPHQRRVA